MKYIDLFAGAGGGSLGVHRTIPDAQCLGCFEIDKDADKIFQSRFKGIKNYGSVLDGDWNQFIGIDLIIAGSPCTDLSIIRNAGQSGSKRESLEGKDSKLFFEFLMAIEIAKPKYFLLENVSSMSKDACDKISAYLGVQPVEINSGLVSAQNRKRLYWCNWEVTQPENQYLGLLDIKVRDHYKYGYSWSKSTRKHKDGIEIPSDYQSPIATNSVQYRSFDERFRQDQKANCLTGSINGSEAMTFFSTKKLHNDLPRKVFNRQDLIPYILAPGTCRKILPLEAERLQTFPDGWCKGVSNTAAYRLMGKAMTVDVIKHIMMCNPEVTNE